VHGSEHRICGETAGGTVRRRAAADDRPQREHVLELGLPVRGVHGGAPGVEAGVANMKVSKVLFADCEQHDHEACPVRAYANREPVNVYVMGEYAPKPVTWAWTLEECTCVCHELPDVLTPVLIEDFLNG
jgi:hypothetical protein